MAIIGGLIWTSHSSKLDVSSVNADVVQEKAAINGQIGDHTYGNMKSKVIIIEYADYQCPGCKSAYPVIKQITEKYKDQIGFIFRNYPLYNAHPNAFAAASAAEAAGMQGKYWEMHDKLYENQSSWSTLGGTDRTDYFASLADQIGGNAGDLRNNLELPAIKQKIDFDAALGKKVNVKGTPSLFSGGKNIGDQDVKDGKTLIPSDTDTATPAVWSDATYFETLVLKPLLIANGIAPIE